MAWLAFGSPCRFRTGGGVTIPFLHSCDFSGLVHLVTCLPASQRQLLLPWWISHTGAFPTMKNFQPFKKFLNSSAFLAMRSQPLPPHSIPMITQHLTIHIFATLHFRESFPLQLYLQFMTHFPTTNINLGFSLALILDSWIAHKPASQNIPQKNRWYISLLK